MKRLYQVTLYNFRGNEYARLLLTVRESQSIADAEQLALASYGNGYKLHSSVFVCMTPDDVNTEI